MENIFESIPVDVENEIFEDLVKSGSVRIERIISKGHRSPDSDWYDQDENEWVMVLKGAGIIAFEDGSEIKLKEGDFIGIPKHKKHKVSWTDPNNITVWLAVFY